MFRTRLISGIVLVILLLALGIAGGDVLLAGLGLVSLIGMHELYQVFHLEKSSLAIAGYGMALLYYVGLRFFTDAVGTEVFLFSMALFVLLMSVYVFSFPKYKADHVMAIFFGVFYVAVMLSCIYLTRMLPGGAYLVWLIFLCSWGCDTCAYCVGVLIGKHKMAPVLSPKKSVEGAVGGVLGAALLTVLYGFAVRQAMGSSQWDIFFMAAISGVGALISMIGDLAASAIKRNYEIKDYGTLIPGHGGILDRFDSVIFTAPVIYFLAQYLS
ncbi:MAG: phosphatidate cytidylyltransferase [Lachnospiraceae bacterium]|nr:phosphatidate cytidylyltransferase [Lachnospiraceae bacterium]